MRKPAWPKKPEPSEILRLKQLAIEDYNGGYLRSDHWYAIRAAALKAAKYQCAGFSEHDGTLQVHHRGRAGYDHIGEERPGDVIVLCDTCHARIHGITERERDRIIRDLRQQIARIQADIDYRMIHYYESHFDYWMQREYEAQDLPAATVNNYSDPAALIAP